jgi:serine/threonine protein kinase
MEKIRPPSPITYQRSDCKDDRILPECGVLLKECRELKCLGIGSFGRTVLLERNGREYVAKLLTFTRGRISNDEQMVFTQTVENLKGLVHPCILRFVGSSQNGNDSGMILMAYLPCGSLAEVLNSDPKPGWWNGTSMMIIVIGIVLGMMEAHKKGICHGNLKPSNVLLDGEHLVRVSDFGSLEWEKAGVKKELRNEFYADQGMVEDDDEDVDIERDVYSFGMILYELEMLGKGLPDVIKRIAFNKILSGTRPELPRDLKDWIRDLIDDCWDLNLKHRPSFERIFGVLRDHNFEGFGGVEVGEVENFVEKVNHSVLLLQKLE